MENPESFMDSKRSRETRFLEILDHSSIILWEIALDGKIIYISPKIEHILGYTIDSLMRRNSLLDIIHPNDRSKYLQTFQNPIQYHSPIVDVVLRILDKTGNIIFFSISANPEFDENGELRGFVGIAFELNRDIPLQDEFISQVHYEELFENITDAMIVFNFNGKILDFNQNALHLLQCNSEDLHDISVFSFFSYTEQILKDKLIYLSDKADQITFKSQIQKFDKSPFVAELTLKQNFFNDESIYVMTINDISLKLLTNEKLESTKQKYYDLIENIQIGIVILDYEYKIKFVNKWFENKSQHSFEELHDLEFFTLFAKNKHFSLKENLDLLKQGFKFQNMELEYELDSQNDTIFQIGSSFTQRGVFNNDRLICVIQDITNQKLIQRKLKARLDYEKSLSKCAEILLKDNDNVLQHTLDILLDVSGVSRVYVFENRVNSLGELCMFAKVESHSPEYVSKVALPEQNSIPYYEVFPRWEYEMQNGHLIEGLIKDFPNSEREILEYQKVKSILIIPIFTGDIWYGFIGFDENKSERLWEKQDIELLQTVAVLIGNYLDRKLQLEQIRQNEQRFKMIADLSPYPIIIVDLQERIEYLNHAFSQILGYNSIDLRYLSDWYYLFDCEDREYFKMVWENNLNKTTQGQKEFRVNTKNGESRFLKIFQTNMGNKKVIYCEDITEIKYNSKFDSLFRDFSIDVGLSKSFSTTINTCLEYTTRFANLDAGILYLFKDSGNLEIQSTINVNNSNLRKIEFFLI